jgi:hypothetical protein
LGGAFDFVHISGSDFVPRSPTNPSTISPAGVTSITAPRFALRSNSTARKEAIMFLIENDASTTLVCQACGGPIFPEQPFIYRDSQPIHSESADCSPEEGWNPHIDVEDTDAE